MEEHAGETNSSYILYSVCSTVYTYVFYVEIQKIPKIRWKMEVSPALRVACCLLGIAFSSSNLQSVTATSFCRTLLSESCDVG